MPAPNTSPAALCVQLSLNSEIKLSESAERRVEGVAGSHPLRLCGRGAAVVIIIVRRSLSTNREPRLERAAEPNLAFSTRELRADRGAGNSAFRFVFIFLFIFTPVGIERTER